MQYQKFTYKNIPDGVLDFELSLYWANLYASLFNSLTHKTETLLDHLNNDFIIACNRIKKYSKIAREKLAEPDLEKPVKEKLQKAIKNLDQIIVELQYHDIIRQKIEHVYSIETKLFHEFDSIHMRDPTFTPEYALVAKDLIRLFHNQFLDIRKDYMQASFKIQKSLFDLWIDRELAKKLQLLLFNTSEKLKLITGELDQAIEKHLILLQDKADLNIAITDNARMVVLEKVRDIYTMQAERQIFNETFELQQEVLPEVDDDDIFF
ncbi:MAG: hypothetical protein RIG62_22110 [Cyclobacteriaceae bacterium]